MKRVLLIAIATSTALAACNEPFSNDDLRFLKALPTEAQMTVDVPGTATSTSGLSEPRKDSPAAYAQQAKIEGEKINGISTNPGKTGVLDIVRAVAALPPTFRDEANDTLAWGPFPGDQVELAMMIKRVHTSTVVKTTSTSTPATVDEYFQYALSARKSASDEWSIYFAGSYAPSEDDPGRGMGFIFVNFEAIHALQGEPTRGLVYFAYDNRFAQRTIEMGYDVDFRPGTEFREPELQYRYSELDGGLKTFIFASRQNFPDLQPDTGPELLVIGSRFLPDQTGRADVVLLKGDLGAGAFGVSECWDTRFMSTYLISNVPGVGMYGDVEVCGPELQKSVFDD